MSAWGQRARLPADWARRVEVVKMRAGGRCECDGWCEQHAGRCRAAGTDCDHARDRTDSRISSLRWLCAACHAVRSQKQAREARAAQAKLLRFPESNAPGLI